MAVENFWYLGAGSNFLVFHVPSTTSSGIIWTRFRGAADSQAPTCLIKFGCSLNLMQHSFSTANQLDCSRQSARSAAARASDRGVRPTPQLLRLRARVLKSSYSHTRPTKPYWNRAVDVATKQLINMWTISSSVRITGELYIRRTTEHEPNLDRCTGWLRTQLLQHWVVAQRLRRNVESCIILLTFWPCARSWVNSTPEELKVIT